MNSSEALKKFWSQFGWKVYEASTVPSQDKQPVMPRITFDSAFGQFDEPMLLFASLWCRSYTWTEIEAKVEEIERFIGGGVHLPANAGFLQFITAQHQPDEDDAVRRIIIQVQVEFYRPKY